jgi:phosphatidylinositol alpha-1,6-mannosyltransferase
MKLERSDVLFVTSGLGAEMGGIGTASDDMVRVLQSMARVTVVVSTPSPSRTTRAARLYTQLSLASLRGPRLVFYEHRGLAALHALVPGLRALPYAIFLHGFEIWGKLTRWQRHTLEGASLLLTNSQTTIDEARRRNPWLPRATVVHLGVQVPERVPERTSTLPLLVMVGRLDSAERFKGHDQVLDAWPQIQAAVPEARFIAIGAGNDIERLRERAQREGLVNVELTGFISEHAKDDWLRSARAVFALGRVEGFGLANVEAAALGIPLIGLGGTVLDELFPADVGVRVVPSLEPAHVAAAAIELLRDPVAAAALGQRGRQHVLAHYTRDRFAERFRAAVRPLVASSKAAARD